MTAYRINCIDGADQVVTTHEFLFRDDLDAFDKATELCAANGVEVWDGTRRVIWMHKGGAARFKIEPGLASRMPSSLALSTAQVLICGLSCRTTLSSELWTSIPPSMSPL